MAPRRHRIAEVAQVADPQFLGTLLSNEEIDFMLEHLGELSETACPPGEDLPDGVNPASVTVWLDRFRRLDDLQKDTRARLKDNTVVVWVGYDAVRAVLEETKAWRATTRELKRRTRGASGPVRASAATPSLYMWDPHSDTAYLGGDGADADTVRTAIGPSGARIELSTSLQPSAAGSLKSIADVAAFVGQREKKNARDAVAALPSTLRIEGEGQNSRLVCPVCEHTEHFDSGNTTKTNAAKGKMTRHLKEAPTHKEEHGILLKRLQSGKVQRRITAAQAQAAAEGDED